MLKNFLDNASDEEKRAFFAFDNGDSDEKVLIKFDRFARHLFPRYFQQKTASFHGEMVMGYLRSYRYNEDFINLGFRGCAKTSLAKLFILFVMLNDMDMNKKYIKFLTKDLRNSKQLVTDVFNMMVEVKPLYGDVFIMDKEIKREETMSTFTLNDGRKIAAGTVGTTHRGHLQDAYRPDWIIFDDIEDKESVSSLPITQGIIDKCDEALTGLAIESSYIVLGNYISAQGTVQWFLNKPTVRRMITPILYGDTVEDQYPSWDIFSMADIEKLKYGTQDFFGEYMCDPERADNRYFDPIKLEENFLTAKAQFRTFQGVRYWENYISGHRYGLGADVGEGSGKDSSTMALFDFTTNTLVATYHNNRIEPSQFAKELMYVGTEFGNAILAPERNNNGVAVIENMREYPNIYAEMTTATKTLRRTDRLGWHTNKKTKPQMFDEFRRDYNDGKVIIYDKEVLQEMRSYSFGDITDNAKSLVTRHFDLLTAVVIAWQMRKHAIAFQTDYVFEEEAPLFSDIGV